MQKNYAQEVKTSSFTRTYKKHILDDFPPLLIMSNLLEIIANYFFSGVPSNTIYELIKKTWTTITHKTWEEIYLDSFQTALEKSRPRLEKYSKDGGLIQIESEDLQKILHQNIDIDHTVFSELNSHDFVLKITQEIMRKEVLIIGGHQLSSLDYKCLIQDLLTQVNLDFKKSVLSDPSILNRVLLDESLKNKELVKETSNYLEQKFDMVLNKLEEIGTKLNQVLSDQGLNTLGALTSEYQSELEYVRDLINKYKPKQALDYLESLKKRIEYSSPPIVKYRLLVNMGAAKLNMNQLTEAAKLFIKASSLNVEHDNKDYYAALGYALLEDYGNARKFIDQIIKANPINENAYTILIQISSGKDLDRIIEEMPAICKQSHCVARALSYISRQKLNFKQAEYWIKIALEKKPHSFEIQAEYAALLLELVNEESWLVQSNQLDQDKYKKLEDAEQLLTSAWETVVDTELREFRPDIIFNRCSVREWMNQLDKAIQDADTAISIAPNNLNFKIKRAILADRNNNQDKAIELFERVIELEDKPSKAYLILADIWVSKKEYDRAIVLAQDFIKNAPESPLSDEAHKIIVASYVESGNVEKSVEILSLIQSKQLKTIIDLINAATISIFLTDKPRAVQFLEEAKSQINKSTLQIEILETADKFYTLEEFRNAAELYELIVNPTFNTPYTHQLINSYYYSGQYTKALSLCGNLRQNHGISIPLCEIELSIQESIGDLNKARCICQEYLKQYPDTLLIKLRLAFIDYRLHNFDELDEFLNSQIEVEELSLELSIQLTKLYGIRNLAKKFFELLYAIRKKFYDKSTVHIQYVTNFFEREKSLDRFLVSCESVCIDSAVYLQDESGQISCFVIVDQENTDFTTDEISLEDPLAKKLILKSVGDEILFKDNFVSQDIRKIVEITNKYVYALRKSLEVLNRQFSETPGFYTLKLDPLECSN